MNKVTAALLLSALLLCACAQDGTQTDTPSDTVGEATVQKEDSTAVGTPVSFDGFALTLSSPAVRLMPGTAADIEAMLGKPKEKLEAPSCIHPGNDTVYYYDGLEIVTSPDKDSSTITSVTLTSDAHKTEEGIAVGAALADASAVYGAHDTKKSSPDFGRYVFVKASTSLTILTDGDNVITSISYAHEG